MTACISCHGARGDGRLEAGVQVPPLTWRALMQPTGRRPAYRDPAQVLAAVIQGSGRGGDSLQAPMPQFALNAAEQQALLAYLEIIGTEYDPVPGVFTSRIVVASVLPLSGRAANTGERVRAALAAQFDAVNQRGGVYGRRIELRTVDGGADAASASRAARKLIHSGDVLALVASLLPDPDSEVRAALAKHRMPMVATLGVATRSKRMEWLTYLLPDLQQQVRLLAAEMAQRCPGDAGVPNTVLHSADLPLDAGDPPSAGATLRWKAVSADQADFSDLLPFGSARLISLLPTRQHEALKRYLSGRAIRMDNGCLGTLAVVTAPADGVELSGWHEVIALPMPLAPSAVNSQSDIDTWTLLGDTAARVLIEALSRSGRQLDPERLVDSVQGLNRFEPQPGLTLSFDAGRMSGFDPEFVWR
ncbi:MAG: ABC transporter substrate-binding protein [Burkholderiaceae bacterium]